MKDRTHRNYSRLIAIVMVVSVVAALFPMAARCDKSLCEAFLLTREVGLPWIPYIAFLTVLFSVLGIVGLVLYKQWAFYAVYLAYLSGTSVAWFPFFPSFLFRLLPDGYGASAALAAVYAGLVFVICLDVSGRRQKWSKALRKP